MNRDNLNIALHILRYYHQLQGSYKVNVPQAGKDPQKIELGTSVKQNCFRETRKKINQY